MKRILRALLSMRLANALLAAVAVLCGLSSLLPQGRGLPFYAENYPEAYLLIYRTHFYDVFKSWYFILLMGLLCLSMLVCTARMFLRGLRGGREAVEKAAALPDARSLEPGQLEQLRRYAASIRCREEKIGEAWVFHKNRIGYWGLFALHLSILLTVVFGVFALYLPKVTDLVPAEGRTETELLQKAAALEQGSEHPLAGAVLRAAEEQQLALAEVTDFRALPGNGLEGTAGGKRLRGGSGSFIGNGTALPDSLRQQADRLAEEGKTPLFFEEDGSLLGVIAVADTVRPDSAEGIRQLKGQGLCVVMLTGDNEKTAKAIAARAGIDEWIAGVLPDEKEAVIRKLQAYGRTAMVGDGINDAPALTRADTGIAIGAGTDVAVDSADIVLMNSSLADVAAAIRLSRGTLRNIHENLFWAFFYNIVCIPLAAGLFGWKMSPMIGAAAMSLSSFTVCMNALRLNLFRLRDPAKDKPLKAANIPLTITEEIRGEREKERKKTMTKTVKIKGMMCGHCEATVKKALEALPFVAEAVVSKDPGTAVLTLNGDLDEAAVKAAVEAKDFTFEGIE